MRRRSEDRRRWLGVAFIVLLVGLLGWMRTTGVPSSETGVVVEEVGKGSTLEKAGLQVGDVLLSWRRLPNLPANPEEAQGRFTSPFDWKWLTIEQSHRGTVQLTGRRDGKDKDFEIAPGKWDGKVRPGIPGPMLEIYLEGKERADSEDLEAAAHLWRKVAARISSDTDWRLRCWFLLRIGEMWGEARESEKAHAAYSSALGVAQDPLTQVTVWQAIGDAFWETRSEFEQAGEAYASAKEIQERVWGESLAFATGLNDVGRVAATLGQIDTAQKLWQQALEIRQKLAPQSTVVAGSLLNLGYLAQFRGELDWSAKYFQQALEIFQRLEPDSLNVANCLGNLGYLAQVRGELDHAGTYYQQSLEISRQVAPESLDVADSLTRLGNLALELAELDKATQYYKQALETAQRLATNSLQVARILNNLGRVASNRGDLNRAADYYQQALGIKQRLAPESLDVAMSQANLANLALKRGALERASAGYQQALKVFGQLAPESPKMASVLDNLGNLTAMRGDLDGATEYYQQALEIRQKLVPNSLDMAASMNNLGSVAFASNKLDQAVKYFQQALEIQQKVAPKSLSVALNLDNLGIAAFDLGELDQASKYYHQALELRQELAPSSLEVATSLHNLGLLAEAHGELKRGAKYHQEALKIRRRLAPNSFYEAMSLNELATISRKQNQQQLALSLLRQSLSTIENQVSQLGGSRNLQAGFRAQYDWYYHETIELLLELNQFEEAFHTMERSRAQSFLIQLAERDLLFADVPEEMDDARRRLAVRYDRTLKQLSKLNEKEHSEEIKSLRSQLRQLHEERDNIADRIRKASPWLAALRYPQPLDLQAVRRDLDPGTVLLSYSIGEEASHLFVVTREEPLQMLPLQVGEEKLILLVDQFHNAAAEQGWALRTASRIEVSKLLYETLVEPATSLIQESDRVLIIPDGPLHRLPFAALIREGQPPVFSSGADHGEASRRNWHYLVEWKPLHSALSATVYIELKKTRRKPSASDTGPAPILLAAFGDPLYPGDVDDGRHQDPHSLPEAGQRGADFRSLPHTRREVEGIAKLYPPGAVQTYLGKDATEERAKALGRDTRILHFATHGQVDDLFPLNSYVALTIPTEFSEGRENGLLQAWEIFERIRLDADLVVLSACKTAIGEELRGEGLIGLTRAFQYAGARSVAATFWNVADQTTAELMIRFYRNLRAGKSKDVALQTAQIEVIRGPVQVQDETGQLVETDASAPYYWAAFQLLGDWQ